SAVDPRKTGPSEAGRFPARTTPASSQTGEKPTSTLTRQSGRRRSLPTALRGLKLAAINDPFEYLPIAPGNPLRADPGELSGRSGQKTPVRQRRSARRVGMAMSRQGRCEAIRSSASPARPVSGADDPLALAA